MDERRGGHADRQEVLLSLLESSSDAIFAVDREYRYTAFNARHAAVMLGAPASRRAIPGPRDAGGPAQAGASPWGARLPAGYPWPARRGRSIDWYKGA